MHPRGRTHGAFRFNLQAQTPLSAPVNPVFTPRVSAHNPQTAPAAPSVLNSTGRGDSLPRSFHVVPPNRDGSPRLLQLSHSYTRVNPSLDSTDRPILPQVEVNQISALDSLDRSRNHPTTSSGVLLGDADLPPRKRRKVRLLRTHRSRADLNRTPPIETSRGPPPAWSYTRLSREADPTLPLSFDLIPPDVTITHIFGYLEGCFRCSHDRRSIGFYIFPGPPKSLGLRREKMSLIAPSMYRSTAKPNVKCLWGYFCRDLFRHPWFLFQSLRLTGSVLSSSSQFCQVIPSCPQVVISVKMIRHLYVRNAVQGWRFLNPPTNYLTRMVHLETLKTNHQKWFDFGIEKNLKSVILTTDSSINCDNIQHFTGRELGLTLSSYELPSFPTTDTLQRFELNRPVSLLLRSGVDNLIGLGTLGRELSFCRNLVSLKIRRFQLVGSFPCCAKLRELYLIRCMPSTTFVDVFPQPMDELRKLVLDSVDGTSNIFLVNSFPELRYFRMRWIDLPNYFVWKSKSSKLKHLECRRVNNLRFLESFFQNIRSESLKRFEIDGYNYNRDSVPVPVSLANVETFSVQLPQLHDIIVAKPPLKLKKLVVQTATTQSDDGIEFHTPPFFFQRPQVWQNLVEIRFEIDHLHRDHSQSLLLDHLTQNNVLLHPCLRKLRLKFHGQALEKTILDFKLPFLPHVLEMKKNVVLIRKRKIVVII